MGPRGCVGRLGGRRAIILRGREVGDGMDGYDWGGGGGERKRILVLVYLLGV